MESSNKIKAELVHLVGEYVSISFHIPKFASENINDNQSVYSMFAIDKSGSMSGSPISDAKGAAESLVTKFKKMSIPIAIYPFDHEAQEFCLDIIGYDSMIKTIQNLYAGGGTQFLKVMKLMEKRVRYNNLNNIFIVWLTDGQDNSGLKSLIPIMQSQKQEFERKGISVSVHCIGFSQNHDAELLSKLSQMGTKLGTFQYVPEGGRIPVAVNNVYNSLDLYSILIKFVGKEGKFYNVEAEKEEGEESWRGIVIVSENDLENCQIQVCENGIINEYEVELNRSECLELENLIFLVTEFISSKIIEKLAKGMIGIHERLLEIHNVIEEANRRILHLKAISNSLRVYKKKLLLPYLETACELIDLFRQAISKCQNSNFRSHDFAKLNSLANALFLKRKLEKRIAADSKEGLYALQEGENQIDKLTKELDFTSIKQNYRSQERNLEVCAISRKNWIECIEDGDCLCATFFSKRPQNLLSNPYDTQIIKLNSTMISHDNFIESVLFETKAGQIIRGSRSYQHGKDPEFASKFINWLPDEYINGIMPIYISDEHWKFARHRIRPMLAYAINANVLDFNQSQLLIFPFMLMAKALEDTEKISDALLNQIINTCRQIYLENEHEIDELIRLKLSNYIQCPEARLEITDNCSLLSQLSFSKDKTVQALIPYLFVEEIRRSLKGKKTIKYHELVIKILDINIAAYYDTVKEKHLRNKMSSIHNINENKDSCPEEAIGCDIAAPNEFIDLGEFARSALDLINSSFEPGGSLRKLSKVLKLLGYSPEIENFGLIKTEQKLIFLIQILCYKKDAEWLSAFKSGKLIDPFGEDNLNEFLKGIYKESIEHEISSFKSGMSQLIHVEESKRKSEVFIKTENLDEAAECILGLKVGSAGFPIFIEALKTPNIPKVIEKITMITRGKYHGKQLLMDKVPENEDFVYWKPKTKTVHEIWKIHNNGTVKAQWKKAFQHKADYFDHIYSRMDGVFVPYSKPKKNVKDERHWIGKNKTRTKRPYSLSNSSKNTKRSSGRSTYSGIKPMSIKRQIKRGIIKKPQRKRQKCYFLGKNLCKHGCEAWGDGPEDHYNWWDTVPKFENGFICNRKKAQIKDRKKLINYAYRGFTSESSCKKVIRHLNWKCWQILDKYDGKDCEMKWMAFIDGFEDSIFHVVEGYFMRKSIRALVNKKKVRKALRNYKKP